MKRAVSVPAPHSARAIFPDSAPSSHQETMSMGNANRHSRIIASSAVGNNVHLITGLNNPYLDHKSVERHAQWCERGVILVSYGNTVDLAQHVERWGFTRFWLAEHHSMPGIASAATSVLIGHVAGKTSRIRVGSGGVMLPNHSPLVIAEQFGTLEALHPGRIHWRSNWSIWFGRARYRPIAFWPKPAM
jgi:Luciferase-like monooxygenase